jgi:phosphoribosylanthranilate isomerase
MRAMPYPTARQPWTGFPEPSHRTRIKICGLTREGDIDAAVAAGADAIGLVLYPMSPRAVTPERAAELARQLPPFVTPVLLFVNASPEEIAHALTLVPQALLQFHGDEAPAQCQAPGRAYLRAVRMGAPGVDLLDCAARYHDAQALLLDAHVDGYGGGGKAFDWSLIPLGVPLPVVLSGGLSPANVTDGVLRVRPWAVDVSSGVESAKGVKDAGLMRRFCENVREADARLALPSEE